MAGASACQLCQPGKLTYSLGVSVCDTCLPGTYSTGSGLTNCTFCSPGTYQSNFGATACTNCVAGTYLTAMLTQNAASCQLCQAGTYSTVLGAPNSLACTGCSTGKFSTASGAVASTTCQACAASKYASALGTTACVQCSTCSAGYVTSTTCVSTQNIVCQPCPAGTIAWAGTDLACTTCLEGTYSELAANEYCYQCDPGTYSATLGATTHATCQACAPGQYSNFFGLSACLYCDVGTYTSSNGAGANMPIMSTDNPCMDCGAGTYASTTGLSACTACAPGTFSPALAATDPATCQDCLAGSFSSATGSAGPCIACINGQYSPANQATTCNSCAPGSYGMDSTGLGATSCTLCFYQATSGCLSCPANMQLNNNLADQYLTWCVANAGYYAGNCYQPFPPPPYMSGAVATIDSVTYTASASSSLAGNEPYKAFALAQSTASTNNGWTIATSAYKLSSPNAGTYLGSFATEIDGDMWAGEWLQLQMSRPFMLGNIAIQANILNSTRAPRGTILAASKDDGATWTNLLLMPYVMTWTAGKINSYDYRSGVQGLQELYTSFRLVTVALAPNQGILSFDKMRLYELGVFQCQPGTYATGLGLTSLGSCSMCAAGTYSTGLGMTLASACTACGIGTYSDTVGSSGCTACPANSNTSIQGASQRGSCVCNPSYVGNLANQTATCLGCPVNYYCAGLLQNTCPAHTHSPALSSLQEQCRCDAGYRCTYTRNVTMRFNFALTQSSYLAQQASIQTQLASAASVPVSSVSSNYTVQAGLAIPPPPPPPAVM